MDLRQIDAFIKSVRSELEYQVYLTPANFAEENERFFESYSRGEIYNPQYTYRRFQKRLDEDALDSLEGELRKEKSGLAGLLLGSLLSLKREIAMYRAVGDDNEFTRLATLAVGEPDRALLPKAEQILRSAPQTTAGEDALDAETLERAVKDRIARYGFDWKVTLLDNMAARVSVEPETRTVYISRKKKFSERDVARLCVHEIDTHVLRSENGRRRGLELLSTGTDGSLIHEEGLALYNERRRGVQDEDMTRLYAARFLGCCRAELSFFEMFDLLVKLGCSKGQAMYVVSRNKRGLSDSARAGGFLKDYVYFQGLHEVDAFLTQCPEMYPALYYGAISIGDLELLEDDIRRALASGEIILPAE